MDEQNFMPFLMPLFLMYIEENERLSVFEIIGKVTDIKFPFSASTAGISCDNTDNFGEHVKLFLFQKIKIHPCNDYFIAWVCF